MKTSIKGLAKMLVFMCISLLLIQTAFAEAPEGVSTELIGEIQSLQSKVDKLRSKTIPIGKITKSAEGFMLRGTALPKYDCMNVSYVALGDLRQIGANIAWNPTTKKTVIYDLNQPIKENLQYDSLPSNGVAYLGRDTVYINYQEVPAIYVDGKALVPVKWIAVLEASGGNPLSKILKKGAQWYIENNMEQPTISGINIWFDGTDYIEEWYTFPQLEQDQDGFYLDNQYDLTPDYDYVGFVINEIDGMINTDSEIQKAWLKNPTYYVSPKGTPAELLNQLFPPTLVKGVMKNAAGGFEKGENVIVQKSVGGSLYFLDGKNGGTVQVPWASVRIQTSPVNKEQATNEQIEEYINKQNLSSKTPYLVWTDLHRQRTYIFQGKKNEWVLIKNILSSSGMDITPTPRGNYTIHTRVPAFGYGKGYLAKNAYAFIGTKYLYHSVLYDSTGKYLLEGRGVLGTKASQGCIRFSPEDIEWFYKTMPPGTAVYIN